MAWLQARPLRSDAAAILLLTLLWAFYFWRVITPDPLNQVSYPAGDFSGQFLSFGAYQARRLLAGEIPLWNPYNYGGHPFIGDTQAAVFYPPRLLTIFISRLTGGWSYAALQAEAVAHVWLASVLMYAFVRRITGSTTAGLVSAITLAYGGYLTGYPPLQLAVLEAGVWLPLALLGIFNAARPGAWSVRWLTVTALALGLSLLAGHPQTSLWLTYVLIAYFVHRAARRKLPWRHTLPLLAATLAAGYALAGVQILPGLEYMQRTVRAALPFDELAHGFPLRDLLGLVIPNVLSLWSPLYSGIAALALAAVAVWARRESARLWGAVVLIALLLSLGGATLVYRLGYFVLPGLSWFRGQERAAFVVAHGVAILAGMGASAVLGGFEGQRALRRSLAVAAIAAWVLAVEVLVLGTFLRQVQEVPLADGAVFLAILLTITWALLGQFGPAAGGRVWQAALVALIAFDVMSLSWHTNWEPVPASERVLYSTRMVEAVQADAELYRVDGRLGLGENHGSLLGIQDIRGTSPLMLLSLERYVSTLPAYRVNELLAVRYVFTDWTQLEVPSTLVTSDQVYGPTWNLHRIDDPLPRAWIVYAVAVVQDDAQALGLLSEPAFNVRTTALLTEAPAISLPEEAPQGAQVEVTRYRPEEIIVEVETPADGILIISEWDYPGWQAEVDGSPSRILRANAGLRALALSAGHHTVTLRYRPVSVRLGAGASLAACAMLLGVFGLDSIRQRRKTPAHTG
jgi:hypothetical protein